MFWKRWQPLTNVAFISDVKGWRTLFIHYRQGKPAVACHNKIPMKEKLYFWKTNHVWKKNQAFPWERVPTIWDPCFMKSIPFEVSTKRQTWQMASRNGSRTIIFDLYFRDQENFYKTQEKNFYSQARKKKNWKQNLNFHRISNAKVVLWLIGRKIKTYRL